jgi:uncharacterized OB-fold protein
MLEGKCPKCGSRYRGWAMLNPRHQTCPRCGTGLEITDGETIIEGYSPFTSPTIEISPPSKKHPKREKRQQQ